MRLKKIGFIGIALASLFGTSCSEHDDNIQWNKEQTSIITTSLAPFAGEGQAAEGNNEVDEMQACLFEGGKLAEVYPCLQKTEKGYTLKTDRMSGTLYLLANATRWVDVEKLQIDEMTEEEWLKTTVTTQDGRAGHFFTGSLDLGKQAGGQTTLPVSLRRGIARFDLQINGDVAVQQVTLKNIVQQGYLLEQPEVASPAGAAKQDETFDFKTPLKEGLQGMAYVYEQANPDSKVAVKVIVGTKEMVVENNLPKRLKRNSVYTLAVQKNDVSQEVSLEVEAWEDGGESSLRPDWNNRLTIDMTTSELPVGAQVSATGNELTLTSAEADFILAVACDDELEYVPTSGLPVTVEPATGTRGMKKKNLFRVHKRLLPPNYPEETATLRFRRKGLEEAYEEDCLKLVLLANPIVVKGDLAFDRDNYTCDFARYVENEMGRFILPEGYELRASFETGEDPWVKIKTVDDQPGIYRVLGGWKPNDMKADGREQMARLLVCRTSDGQETEAYIVKRRNFGLPVTQMNGIWWCKYNARGNAKDFADQILVPDDPATKAGKSLLDYLVECTDEEYLDLWGWSYLGDTGAGLRVVDKNWKACLEGYATPSADFNKVDVKSLAPTGYEVPSLDYYNRLFWGGMNINAEGKHNGPYTAQDPNYRNLSLHVKKRADLAVGDAGLSALINFEVSNQKGESVVFYGPGAQWNGNGINNNKMIFGCHSTNGQNWFNYMGGSNLILWNISKENSRILRFVKSPVEYMY